MPEMTPETLKTAVKIIRNWRIARLNREKLDTMASHLSDLASAWESDIKEWECLNLHSAQGLAIVLDLRKRIAELENAGHQMKAAFGCWLPRTENTNVPKVMTDALEVLFAALAGKEKPE